MPLDMSPERGPIENIEAEQSVLGAVLVNNDVLARLGSLRTEHFYDPIHGELFSHLENKIQSGDLASPVTVKDWFSALPSAAQIGGAGYLLRLTDSALTVFDAPANARTIVSAHARRSIVAAATEAIESAYAGHEPQETASMLDASVIGLDFGKPRGRYRFSETMRATAARVSDAYQADGRPIGIMTGLTDLDKTTRGFRRGNLVVVAGRPGMGKSAFAASVAHHNARCENPFSEDQKKTGVIIVSLEMSDEEYGVRFVSDAMRSDGVAIPYSDALDGFSGDAYKQDQEGIMRSWVHAARDIENLPISIADMAAQSPLPAILSEIRRRAAMLADAGSPVGLVVIDHLGLIALPNTRDNEASRVGYITAAMKGLAKRMECCVMLLSQLNRGVESRDEKRPTLADLRNSGSIEQDADVVLFPFRPEYYIQKEEPSPESDPAAYADWQANLNQWKSLSEIRVAKNRSGPEGLATVRCDIACNHFSDFARGNYQ